MKLTRTFQNLVVLALTLLAFLLRAYRLDFQSYWIDEAWTVYLAHLPLDELLRRLLTVEPHPPLYFPSIMAWTRWAGNGEYALRFYSLVFGVLAVPFTYRLGKDLGGSRLGLIGSVLMTTAPFQVWYSQEARMYSLLAAAAGMSMWGFVNLWRRGGWRWWLVYVLGTWWLLLSHYHGLVVIGSQGLFLLLTWRRHWRRYHTWLGALLVVFVLYLPWLLLSWDLLRNRTSWTAQPTLAESFARSAIAYSVGERTPRPEAAVLTLVFVALYLAGLVYAARRRWGSWRGRDMLALLLAYTLAPILAAWLYGEWRTPVYLERYLIPVQTGYLLTVALGILAAARAFPVPRFQRRWLGAGLAVGLLLLLAGINSRVLYHHYTDPLYAKPDWRGVAQTIGDYEMPGDAIVVTGDGGEKVLNFYYQGELPVYYPFNTPVPPEAEAHRLLADIAARHRRIWYIPYGVPVDALLEQWLAEQAYPAWQSWLGSKRLALYAGSQAAPGRVESVNRSFAGSDRPGPELVTAALPGQAVAAGDLLPLAFTWQTPAALDTNYQLSLRLVNPQGDIFAQSDWPPLAAAGAISTWPPGRPVIDHRSLWLPPDTPPGLYSLQVVLYDPIANQGLGQPVALTGEVKVDPAQILVAPERLAVPNLTHRALGSLALVGYAMPEKIQPGQEMWLWLYWQAGQKPHSDTLLALELRAAGDRANPPPVAGAVPLAASTGPLASWRPGQVRRAVYRVPTSPDLEAEKARLRVTLFVQGEPAGQVTLDQEITLEVRPRQFEAPEIQAPTDLTLGRPALLKLLGYDLPQAGAAPDQPLPVTLYYRAEAAMDTNYTVFVQLLDARDQVVAQADGQPLAGAAPTTTWRPGEILTDPHTLLLPGSLPPGSYRLIAGFYNAATGERLPVSNGKDFVELQQVTVK